MSLDDGIGGIGVVDYEVAIWDDIGGIWVGDWETKSRNYGAILFARLGYG